MAWQGVNLGVAGCHACSTLGETLCLTCQFYWINWFIFKTLRVIQGFHLLSFCATLRLILLWERQTTSPLKSSCRRDTTSCVTGGLWASSCMKCSSVRQIEFILKIEIFAAYLTRNNIQKNIQNIVHQITAKKSCILFIMLHVSCSADSFASQPQVFKMLVVCVQVIHPSALRRRRRRTGRWWTGRRPSSSHLKSPSQRGPKTWY